MKKTFPLPWFLSVWLLAGLDPLLAQVELDVNPEIQTPGRVLESSDTAFYSEGTDAMPATTPGQQGAEAADRQLPETDLRTPGELPVFGQHLFTGGFGNLSFSGFNPNYQIGVGDKIQLMLWGGLSKQVELTVDPQGNIFVPEVGPVQVLGVPNGELAPLVRNRVRSVFRDTVESYAVLSAAQPVKVFVTGNVVRPGLYGGVSADSVLYFLQKAGGIDLERGSFLDIQLVKLGGERVRIDLYNFLTDGNLRLQQLSDGDRIVVRPLRHTVSVEGSVRNAARFEFLGPEVSAAEIFKLAQPDPTATHFSVQRSTEGETSAAYYPLEEATAVVLESGDSVTVTRDLKPSSILVNIEGEHGGSSQQVHPYGATLREALAEVQPVALSNMRAVQLFRESVAERQKQRIEESLDNLERNVLNARSNSVEEARIRNEEAQLLLQFVERARDTEPKGQVILGRNPRNSAVTLEDGDTIFIPETTNLVSVHGQVTYPTTQVWDSGKSVNDYVNQSGGLTDNADTRRVLVVQTNGVVRNLNATGSNYKSYDPRPGEEIIVLPRPDKKGLQFAKDISTILYEIAVATRVALGF